MRPGRVLSLAIACCILFGLGYSVKAQQPAKQEPAKAEAKKATEKKKVFCATRSEAIRVLMVGTVNCEDQCKGLSTQYQCDTNKDLKDGWRIISFDPQELIIQKSPCECKISGTEAQMER